MRTLSNYLKKYNPSHKYYIGLYCCTSCDVVKNMEAAAKKKHKCGCHYACGSGYCFSAALMKESEKYFRGENFVATCNKHNLTDDVAIGAIVGK